MPGGNFAFNLRAALDEAGLTQAQLAERTGCTQPDISRYLSSGRIPSGDKLVAMAQALDTTAEDLLAGRPPAVANHPIGEDGQRALLPPLRPRRKGNFEKLRKLAAKVEDALKVLRDELEREE